MNPADNPSPSGETPPPAAGAELHQIPKHRFDEKIAEVQRLREEISMKDRLYLEDRQRMAQAQNPRARQLPSAEELNIDPNQHQALVKLAHLIADEKTQLLTQQLGFVSNRVEKANLLATKGADTARFFPEIERIQQDHVNRTGTYMETEIAYEIFQNRQRESKEREKDERMKQMQAEIEALKSGNPVPTHEPPATSQSYSVPNASATRQIPSGGGVSGGPSNKTKSFSELSLEEMEARLQEQFNAGERL